MVEQTSNVEQQVRRETKGEKKFLNRFVNFLIYGGWLLILFLGVALVIVISIAFS